MINGRAAVEYPERNPITRPQDHGPDISVSHNYVEAVDGAEFSVEAQVLRNDSLSKSWVEGRKQGLLFALSIDGEKELTLDHINDVSQLCQLEGVIDHATLKKFRFSPLSVGKLIEICPRDRADLILLQSKIHPVYSLTLTKAALQMIWV